MGQRDLDQAERALSQHYTGTGCGAGLLFFFLFFSFTFFGSYWPILLGCVALGGIAGSFWLSLRAASVVPRYWFRWGLFYSLPELFFGVYILHQPVAALYWFGSGVVMTLSGLCGGFLGHTRYLRAYAPPEEDQVWFQYPPNWS